MATPPSSSATTPSEPNPYLRVLARLERAQALDPVVDAVTPAARALIRDDRVRRLLDGAATGVPLHPIFTDVPFGAWFMAQYLDLFADEASRVAARRLVGLGVIAAAPTAITGWARWAATPRETRRAGVVHAAVNAVGALTFAASWAARSHGHHGAGATLARLGSVALIAGGFLGGHLARNSPLPGPGVRADRTDRPAL